MRGDGRRMGWEVEEGRAKMADQGQKLTNSANFPLYFLFQGGYSKAILIGMIGSLRALDGDNDGTE